MARSRSRHVTGNTITTKSWFGSHTEMVVEDREDGTVVCEDDRGKYVTYKDRLDSGLADPCRAKLNRDEP